MKTIFFIFSFLLLFVSCAEKKNSTSETNETQTDLADTSEKNTIFFPVTDFMKGEVQKIKMSGKNPIKYFYNKANKKDSTWIQLQDFDSVFNEFYTPAIDSTSDAKYYKSSNFFDNTINAITLTYDPLNVLPSSKRWAHWDVYIDPKTNLVTRVYLVKSISDSTIRQLTWIPEKSCKALTIVKNQNTSVIKDEINIKW